MSDTSLTVHVFFFLIKIKIFICAPVKKQEKTTSSGPGVKGRSSYIVWTILHDHVNELIRRPQVYG